MQQLKKLAKLIEDNEKLPMALFAIKLAKASAAYPEDHTIGTMYDVVSRMSDAKLFITKAEIKDLYNKLYSRNTKFAQVFQEEMGEPEVAIKSPTLYDRSGNEHEIDVNEFADPILATALNNAFGNSTIV